MNLCELLTDVLVVCLTARNNDEHIKSAVLSGNRPPLTVISGPTDLVKFAKKWIPLCWHKKPKKRPSFDGKLF